MLIFRVSGSPWQLPLATAGHNRLTRLQQGGFAASLVSFPYLALKTAHRGIQGRVWFSPSFPGTLLLRQPRQLALQVVVDSFLDGADSEL